MTKLSKTNLKEKISNKLNSRGIDIDVDTCIDVFEKCKSTDYKPETDQERWTLQQLKKAGVVVRDFVYRMPEGFDDKPQESDSEKE